MSDRPHRTLLLVRHAKAADRMTWEEDDRFRPLTKKGDRQALLLAEALGGEPIRRIMSSPATRCVETARPLSAAIAVTLDVEDGLFEGHRIDVPDGPGTYVICAHGDNIPDLLVRLGVDFDVCQKAGVWRVELDESGKTLNAAYQPPPE